MQDLQGFNPTNTSQLIMGVIFYGLLIILVFFSFSSVYVLIKNGRSRGLSFFISFIYLMFFFSLITQGVGLLNQIK